MKLSEFDQESIAPGLRAELFVSDVERSTAFYVDVLGFEVVRRAPGGYVAVHRPGAAFGLNRIERLHEEHPVSLAPGERYGRGVEFVVMVEDVVAAHLVAQRSGWPLQAGLTRQSWGLTDFRVIDPDGFYIRVTGLREPPEA